MGIFSDYEYEPTNIDTEIFLSSMPLSIMEDNIKSQFKNPLEYRKVDYVHSFFRNYKYSVDNAETDEELIEIDDFRSQFVQFMCELFHRALNIGLPDIEDKSKEDQEELIRFTYRYFITNIKRNFVNFILNYIYEHKKHLCENAQRKKDISSLSLKKEIDDNDDVLILSNLSDIIDYILNDDSITVTDFIRMSDRKRPSFEAMYIDDRYNDFSITGNFIKNYVNMVDNDFKVEIEQKVRNHILKQYRKKLI